MIKKLQTSQCALLATTKQLQNYFEKILQDYRFAVRKYFSKMSVYFQESKKRTSSLTRVGF